MFKEEKVSNISEMWEKLSKESLSAGYTLMKMAFSGNDTQATVAAKSTAAEFAITISLGRTGQHPRTASVPEESDHIPSSSLPDARGWRWSRDPEGLASYSPVWQIQYYVWGS